MKLRTVMAVVFAALAAGALSGAAAARDCGWRCAQWAQNRGQDWGHERPNGPPFLRGPGREYYGGPGDRLRSVPPAVVPGREPLGDGQIWAIAKSRVPGRIVNARLQGTVYSFRILSNRGSIVDVVVDRYSGRIVSVRGGP
jgi:uncharacterized membrane protein YkoI